MDLKIKGKNALVTGSSDGIGKAIAQRLAREGAKVFIHGRNEKKATKVAEEIKADGGDVEVVIGDVSSDEQVNKVVEYIKSKSGIEILVNNAGYYENKSWWTTSSDDWVSTYQTDVLSSLRFIQGLVPDMKKNGWGRVIQIGSGTGSQPFANYPHYCAANAARTNATVSLARELKGTGVTSNIISPGLIVTDSVKDWFMKLGKENNWGESWEEIEAEAVKQILPNDIGRFGKVEEIADVTAFLASPLSAYVSGANWRVDGGAMIGIN